MYFWSLISNIIVTCMPIAWFISWLFTANVFFSVFRLWHTCGDFHPNRGSKESTFVATNCHILLKNGLLKLNFQQEGHVNVIFLIYILTFYSEFLLFQFFSGGGVEKGHISRRKNSHILLKNVVCQAFFSRWRSIVFQLFDLYSLVLS